MSYHKTARIGFLVCISLLCGLLQYSHSTSLRLGDFSGSPGQETYAWLRIDDAAGLASIQFQVNYDRNLLSFISATNHVGTLGAEFSLDVEPGDGVVIIRLFRDSSLESGAGDLVTMQFGVNPGATEGMSSGLVLADVDLATQYGADLRWNTTVVAEDAIFSVGAPGSSDLLFVRSAGFGGTVSGDDSGFYPAGRQMSVSATAAEYFSFVGWEGDFEGAPSNPNLQIVLNRPREVTARFIPHVTSSTGTPLWWLAQQGFTGDFEAIATEDPHGKGIQLWQEFIAGTDPWNPSDFFVFDTLSHSNANVAFRFFARVGRRYTVWYRKQLLDGSWEVLSGYSDIIGNGTQVEVEDAAADQDHMRFYRIAVELE